MALRVAFIVGPFPKVSETFIQRQIVGLLERDVDVHIFPEHRSHAFLDPRLKDRLHYPSPTDRVLYKISPIRAMSARIKSKGDFDIIHVHFGHLAAKYVALKNKLDIKWVVSFHGFGANVVPQMHPQIYDELIPAVDLITVNSNFLKDRVQRLGFDATKMKLIPVGLESRNYKLTTNEGGDSFISIGRLHEAKGFEYAIDAYQKFSTDNPSSTYTIVGDGEYASTLREKAKGTNIAFVGAKSPKEIADLLGQHSIFIMPSVVSSRGDEETQGLVLQEAQACGLVYIASDIGGISEGACPGSGWLVKEKDSNSIYDSMILARDCRKDRRRMGSDARRFVESKYEMNLLSDKLVAAYLESL